MPIISPNMNLPIPVVGVDSGPGYATSVDNCLTLIDSHSHVAGQGVLITPAAMSINSNLSFNQYNITNLNALTLSVSSGTPVNQSIYVAGVDLYYIDGNGNSVKMTSGGTVNATSSGISSGTASASFVGGVLKVLASSTSSANIDVASVVYRNVSPNTFGVTVSAPGALASNYTLTLPGIPAQTNVMTLDTSGNMGSTTYDAVGQAMSATGANAIANSRTRATSAATEGVGGVAVSVSSGLFSTSSNSYVNVVDVTLTTSGRPVMLQVVSDGTNSGDGGIGCTTGAGAVGAAFQFLRGSSGLGEMLVATSVAGTLVVPQSSLVQIDRVAAGTYIYRLQIRSPDTQTAFCRRAILIAYEL